ncbi:hypothetical protein ACJX0J_014355, partial [Zea mays]
AISISWLPAIKKKKIYCNQLDDMRIEENIYLLPCSYTAIHIENKHKHLKRYINKHKHLKPYINKHKHLKRYISCYT